MTESILAFMFKQYEIGFTDPEDYNLLVVKAGHADGKSAFRGPLSHPEHTTEVLTKAVQEMVEGPEDVVGRPAILVPVTLEEYRLLKDSDQADPLTPPDTTGVSS